MACRFFIRGSQASRPPSRRTIFCDGSADETYREGIDLELSHWVPNRTPPPYRADTSTEICMKFVDDPAHGEFDLAINNHADIDGILAVFTLVEPERALAERRTLVEAAEIGDFWGWGELPAQHIFQRLTLLMNRLEDEGRDGQQVYAACFESLRALLDARLPAGETPDAGATGPGSDLEALHESVRKIESGEIERELCHERFVHYRIPASVAAGRLERALHVPEFNAPISDACLLWPQARARRDAERVHLVSVQTEAGWYYDLWYPGYMWADTPHRWRPGGLIPSDDSDGYGFHHPPLESAVAELESAERGPGQWSVTTVFSAFETLPGRGFPVVLSVLGESQQPAPSTLPPDAVADRLAAAFA